MFGLRCTQCGEVRWSIIGRSDPDRECPVCGAEMVDERRHPGGRRKFVRERRDLATTPPRAGSRLSPR